jgi:hypothetical protein
MPWSTPITLPSRPLSPPPVDVEPPAPHHDVGEVNSYNKIAETNAQIGKAVQPLPARGSQDGVDRSPAAPGEAEGKKVEPKEPERGAGKGTEDAVKQANKEAMAELKKYNAFELMKMVRTGDIPEAILNNPLAMSQMLERVQEFSRMIQMMTNMMQVEHETLSSIIRNIKA